MTQTLAVRGVIAAACMTGAYCATVALGQAQGPNGTNAGQQGGPQAARAMQMAQRMVQQFDRDGDQALNAQELAFAMMQMQAQGGGPQGGPGGNGPGMNGPGGNGFGQAGPGPQSGPGSPGRRAGQGTRPRLGRN